MILQFGEVSNWCSNVTGDLKRLLVSETSLQPSEQRLLYRGKEKDDGEYLHVAGVKDKSKIILVEDPASREKKIQAKRKEELIARACKAIATVRAEVDRLGGEVCHFVIYALLSDVVNSSTSFWGVLLTVFLMSAAGYESQILSLQGTVLAGKKVPENDFEVLTEKLMMQLLKLDSIDADGEAKNQRRVEVGIFYCQ